jgi:hypothetical protein
MTSNEAPIRRGGRGPQAVACQTLEHDLENEMNQLKFEAVLELSQREDIVEDLTLTETQMVAGGARPCSGGNSSVNTPFYWSGQWINKQCRPNPR